MEDQTTYLLKLEKSEKDLWKKYAKTNYRGNMARLIRIAVNRMVNGELNTNTAAQAGISQDQLNKAVNQAMDRSNMKNDVLRVENEMKQIVVYLASVMATNNIKLKINPGGKISNDF